MRGKGSKAGSLGAGFKSHIGGSGEWLVGHPHTLGGTGFGERVVMDWYVLVR